MGAEHTDTVNTKQALERARKQVRGLKTTTGIARLVKQTACTTQVSRRLTRMDLLVPRCRWDSESEDGIEDAV